MKMATQPSGWAGSDLPAAPAKLTKQTPSSWCVVPRCSNICSLWKTAEEFRLRLWFLSNDALKIDVIRSKTSWGYKFFPLIVEQQRDEPSQKQHAFLQPSLNWRFLSNQNTGRSSSRHLPSLMILSGNYINSFHTLDPFLLMWSMTSFSWGTFIPQEKGSRLNFPWGPSGTPHLCSSCDCMSLFASASFVNQRQIGHWEWVTITVCLICLCIILW